MTQNKIEEKFISIYATHLGFAMVLFEPNIKFDKLMLVDIYSDDLASDNRIFSAVSKYFPPRQQWGRQVDHPKYIFVNSACDAVEKLKDLVVGVGVVDADFGKLLYRLKSDLVDGVLFIPDEFKGEINMRLSEASIDNIDRLLVAIAIGCLSYNNKPDTELSALSLVASMR